MKAPDGSPIVATLETIPGSCGIVFDEDGSWNYNGTELDWDGQQTVLRAGQTVFVDENGKEWLESQLVPDDAEELPADQIKPWFHDRELRRVEIVNTIEKLMERITHKKLLVKDCEFLTRAVTLLLTRSEPEG
ncbi:hypothetical protein [Mesorhizobium sp.]|uniref:hypothetical protein n=1 Tax=Mesorhizobium sp. TaxID=1871066 RepID=UPI000FE86C0C|nr:hypothetical protein [Mesorhizobium sp.]RWH50257.1 MAG: hypothetical protein EOQ80_04610 [Mesorhizobium sp.]RWH52277.1 MAG: hypothetical protein EOQ82_26635 [Mesorhizobium sp.]RWI69690.1 MAG: hypothetical protein EOR18_20900 [Mesorhizobium sp.]RWI76157.1 MAG: hypothetical protein EOR19_18490 [Mesorhizobium sp.]RWJ33227.1 MAG: hypothetical protein EOR28_11620 [Mesorhizobium sp.]